jgi:hypothetical protein
MHKNRIANIILIIFVVIVSTLTGYFIVVRDGKPIRKQISAPMPNITMEQPKAIQPISLTNETADWKKYTDEWGIVEFLYPSSMHFSASVIVFVPPDNFENWLTNNPLPGSGSSAQTLISSEDLKFGNLQGKKRIFDLQMGRTNQQTKEFEITNWYKHTEVSMTDNKKLLVIDFDWKIGAEEQEQQIIDQIISTIKFFDVKLINITDWKTYKNEKYEFEFKYPSNYKIQENGDGSDFEAIITSPKTEQIIEGTGGEMTDQISIAPQKSASNVADYFLLAQPIQLTEEYFSSEEVKNGANSYLGKIITDKRTGFQLLHSEFTTVKYSLFKNSDGTWFVIESPLFSWIPYSKNEMIEPYDTIVKSLRFNQ